MDTTKPTSWRGTRVAVFAVIVGLVVIIDQAFKAAMKVLLEDGTKTLTLIPGLFDLRLVHNTGAAFSIGEGSGLFFIIVAIVILVISLIFVVRTPELPFKLVLSIACVCGGGVGNMIDRIFDGAVTDFIATTFIDFPIFNVADIFVTVGVAFTIFWFLSWEEQESQKEQLST